VVTASLVRILVFSKLFQQILFSKAKGAPHLPRELPVSQSHLCGWQEHEADPPENFSKAHGKISR